MKKSKAIQLVILSTVVAAACTKTHKSQDWGDGDSRLHVRTDTAGSYTPVRHGGGFFFLPFGMMMMNGFYQRTGYTSPHLAPKSNIEHRVNRGGFGRSAYRVGS